MIELVNASGVSLSQRDDTLFVEGDMSIHAAAPVAAAGVEWLEKAQTPSVTFDFTGVTSASSAALSVLFEWLRGCERRALPVERIALSSPLMRLAAFAELEALILDPRHALPH
ncbi:STAS domain-containing protein [Vreelandella malpeensis]|uniref:STAS domain-containing protein n=1 Tax=Vreelandella malpeensis TaxID=1172368 RepID=A0ABS8DTQ6_9GAMM|nr:STAS domain-containing protein [Halomonas malpeensis]